VTFTKDYYEILGVRPTAKPIEIELAYKGRRTQYHPDRYAHSDAETLRWATSKMQDINEAYETLRDPRARERYDQWHRTKDQRPSSDGNAGHAQEKQTDATDSTAPPDDLPCLYDYLTAIHLNPQDAGRFHLAPHIPFDKLATALSARSVFSSKPPKSVYLLVDDTVFGGGEDGLVMTDEIISFKELFGDSVDYQYSQGWNGSFHAQGLTISRYGQRCLRFSFISASAVQMLTWAMNLFLEDLLDAHTEHARAGNAQSQFILSNSCHDDPAQGFYWLQLAAENSHANAQYNLGMYYLQKDAKQAFGWFKRSAEQGHHLSRERLKMDVFNRFWRA